MYLFWRHCAFRAFLYYLIQELWYSHIVNRNTSLEPQWNEWCHYGVAWVNSQPWYWRWLINYWSGLRIDPNYHLHLNLELPSNNGQFMLEWWLLKIDTLIEVCVNDDIIDPSQLLHCTADTWQTVVTMIWRQWAWQWDNWAAGVTSELSCRPHAGQHKY